MIYRRRDRRKWKKQHQIREITAPMSKELVEWHVNLAAESERVYDLARQNANTFRERWNKYENKTLKESQRHRMADNWIPQREMNTGKEYFMHAKTGKSTNIHPNTLVVKQMLSKQWKKASETHATQEQELLDIVERFQIAETKHREKVELQMKDKIVHHLATHRF